MRPEGSEGLPASSAETCSHGKPGGYSHCNHIVLFAPSRPPPPLPASSSLEGRPSPCRATPLLGRPPRSLFHGVDRQFVASCSFHGSWRISACKCSSSVSRTSVTMRSEAKLASRRQPTAGNMVACNVRVRHQRPSSKKQEVCTSISGRRSG